MVIEVMIYGDEKYKYYFVNEEDLVDLNYLGDGEYEEEKGYGIKGFYNNSKGWITDENTDSFNVVEYEELKREYDAFGTGYDKIIAKIDGEEKELVCSRWQGQTGYLTEHEEE